MQAELETINISREEAQQAAQDRQRDEDLTSKPYVLTGPEGYVKKVKLHIHQNWPQIIFSQSAQKSPNINLRSTLS